MSSKEKGILFKGEMVRAILEGRKTQTRRLLKCPAPESGMSPTLAESDPTQWRPSIDRDGLQFYRWTPVQERLFEKKKKLDWEKGDILYVRESFWLFGRWEKIIPHEGHFEGDMYWKKLSDKGEYVADYETEPPHPTEEKIMIGGIWRKMPSLHLPKKDSRIWLLVTNVRIERLLDISEVDAIAEGVKQLGLGHRGQQIYQNYSAKGRFDDRSTDHLAPIDAGARYSYLTLWDKINGAGSHKANPFVVVVEFERIDKPISK